MFDRVSLTAMLLTMSAPAFGLEAACLDWSALELQLAAHERVSVLLVGDSAKAFLKAVNAIPPETHFDFPTVRVSVKPDGLTIVWLESGKMECFVTWLSEANGRKALEAALGRPT